MFISHVSTYFWWYVCLTPLGLGIVVWPPSCARLQSVKLSVMCEWVGVCVYALWWVGTQTRVSPFPVPWIQGKPWATWFTVVFYLAGMDWNPCYWVKSCCDALSQNTIPRKCELKKKKINNGCSTNDLLDITIFHTPSNISKTCNYLS